MKDNWLNDIKDRLSDYEMDAPDGLWESIQETVNAETAKHKNTRMPLWQRISAIAAAAAIIIICGWQLLRISDKTGNLQPETYAEIIEDSSINASESSMQAQSSIAQVLDTDSSDKNQISTSSITKQQNQPQLSVEEKIVSSTDNAIDIDEIDEEVQSIDTADKSVEDNEEQVKTLSIYKGVGDDYVAKKSREKYPIGKRKKDSNNRLALGVTTSAAGTLGIQNIYEDDNVRLANAEPIDIYTVYDYSHNDSIYKESGSYSTEEITTRSANSTSRYLPDSGIDDISHHVPLKFGLTFMYRFNKVLALETGLQYTNLRSDIEYHESSTLFSDARQTLHYLGIPVNLIYTPVSWKRLSIYLSGGFSFDECIYGNLKGNLRTQSSTAVHVQSIRIDEHPFQVSANVGAGLQFAITDFCGIFAEPTIGYYFDDGSSLSTVYKKHPWNFNVSLGLRFSIGK